MVVNFDALVGPTHAHGGLAHGNVASMAHRDHPANPRAAALEGIAKMRALVALGVPQAVLPPHERPHLGLLRALGFGGSDRQVLRAASRAAPRVLTAASSASAMWAANWATVSGSDETADGRVHLTPANLTANAHRAIETATSHRILARIFDDEAFVVHDPLPSIPAFGDEGAANQTRLAVAGARPVTLLVHGRDGLGVQPPTRFPARQTRVASETHARRHALAPERVHHLRQTPAAVDAGVFHNDVIAVGHERLLLCHERAWDDQRQTIARLRTALGGDLVVVEIADAEVPLADAVASYLFNSQVVTAGDGRTVLVTPAECEEVPSVRACLARILGDSDVPVDGIVRVTLGESMRNGGGPACLRLPVPLTAGELDRVEPGVLVDEARLDVLEAWVRRHYRDRLTIDDLGDPALLDESRGALDGLSRLLGLGTVYDFQQDSLPVP